MKKNIFRLGVFVAISWFFTSNISFSSTDLVVPEESAVPAFEFSIFHPGEYLVGSFNGEAVRETSDFLLNPYFYQSLKQAGYYWSTMLKRPVSAITPATISVLVKNLDGASAGSSSIDYGGLVEKTLLNAMYNNIDLSYMTPTDAITVMNIGTGVHGRPYSVNEFNVLPLNSNPDLNVVIAHEMGHALGILANTRIDEFGVARFNNLSDWTRYLRVEDINGNIQMPTSGRKIEINDPFSTDSAVFNIATNFERSNAPYFAGENTLNVLNGGSSRGTFKHYQDDYNGVRVRGLPINGVEEDSNGNLTAELSHIELRNSYMSHQDYRNWSTFMEAELAVMKDLGYDVDLREHYGKSYYTDGNVTINDRGFGMPDGIGGYRLDEYNNTPFGMGLHIYGDDNNITQTGKILSGTNGLASVGARIEGINNNLTINTTVDMQGGNSVGILTSYGKGHNITINDGAEVKATGNNGIGASFNFGKNVLGEHIEHRGSYIRSCINPFTSELDAESVLVDDIKGALVDNFIVKGALEGSKAAIYIDDTAYVKQIDIDSTANIKGDIISNWNSKTSGLYSKVQLDQVPESDLTDELLLTDLNFNDYNTNEFNDNITGKTLVMNVNGNGLKFNGRANVYNLNNESTSTLNGTGKYQIENTFTNKGTYNAKDGSVIIGGNIVNTGNINFDGNVTLGSNVGTDGTTWGNLTIGATSPAIVNFTKDVNTLYNNVFIDNNSTLNLANNKVGDLQVGKMTFNSDANMTIDLDLVSRAADRLKFENTSDLTMNGKTLHIAGVNLFGNIDRAIITEPQFSIPLLSKDLHNENLNIDFRANLPTNTFTSAIFKYNLDYDRLNSQFMMTSPFSGGSSNYKNFNPAVFAGAVGAQVGSYLSQINSYNQAFANFDMIMALSREQRQAMKYANKYASAGNGIFTYSPNQIPEEDKGLWFRPYVMFEKVNLNNGPSVGNVAYGSFFGGDSGIIELKRGWDIIYAGYVGYNGSHQTYDGIGIEQNGGQLGGSVFAYKNNFWSGLTLNVGANFARANNQYGNDDFKTLSTGIASKMGYNFEFNRGRFILQPNLLLSYSFVNMFNYTNPIGVAIKSDPLNAIQIAPGLKLIGNFKNGFQPYLSVQMIWNILDKTRFSAATVSLPQMSVDPYVQYGVGVQKRTGDRFTGFLQAMLRNGGTNGIALSAGFRWALGK